MGGFDDSHTCLEWNCECRELSGQETPIFVCSPLTNFLHYQKSVMFSCDLSGLCQFVLALLEKSQQSWLE